MGTASSKFVKINNAQKKLLSQNKFVSELSKKGFSYQLNKTLDGQQDSFEIEIGNGKNILNLQWLRHHCRCKDCFDPSTLQKKLIPAHLPSNPQIQNFDISKNATDLNIKWTDDHLSTFDVNWLIKTHPKPNNTKIDISSSHHVNFNFIRKAIENQNGVWKSSMDQNSQNPIEVHFHDFYLGNESFSKIAMTNLISNVQTFGYSLLTEVPATPEIFKSVVSKIARPMSTLYSPDISIASSDLAFKDSAYTSNHIYLHTDMTYYNEPAGIEIFHCLKYNGSGGKSFLSDGFKVADKLFKENPKYYEILSTIPIPSQYLDPDGNYNYKKSDLTISHNIQDGRIERFRFNPHDIGDLKDLKFEEIPLFYQSLIRLSELIEENPLTLELRPGKILFFDNWRMLHGRSEYKGTRTLASAYINRSDWLSRARTLNIENMKFLI